MVYHFLIFSFVVSLFSVNVYLQHECKFLLFLMNYAPTILVYSMAGFETVKTLPNSTDTHLEATKGLRFLIAA